jgi:hypothetical protein
VSTLIAIFSALATANTISLFPPGIHPRHEQIAGAALHVLVDEPESKIADPRTTNTHLTVITRRTALLANMLASPPVVELVARRVGVAPAQISAIPRLTSRVPDALRDPNLERHASDIIQSHKPYRLEIQADPDLPVLNIFAQAPTPQAAAKLADSTVVSLREYLHTLAVRNGVRPPEPIVMQPLGRARGGVINGHVGIQIAALAFLLGFGVSLGALLLARRVRRGWIAARREEDGEAPPEPTPAPAAQQALAPVDDGGDWPRTSRVLPWTIAGFIAMLWLVPFNTIQLAASGPIDLKLDRLVLPFIFIVWLLSLATGGPAAPRVRPTWIHAGIAGFVVVACFSAVVDAGYLNQILEFELATKKVTLLLSYAMFFVLVASVVRPTEVRAFMKYTLILAVVCAVGTIWQYRFHYDVFYDMAQKFLPGFFTVGQADGGVDDIGRFMTQGPAEHPLEAVAMLSMALPIAFVGMMKTTERRTRFLYGLAACLIIGAAVSTYRKSALLGPLSIVLTLAYFQRRELLRLSPLTLVSVVLIHAVSPGALGSVLFQFQPDRLGVGTVSDRAADYDAIRPDVWSHLPFGLGYGSYDHVAYRVLDSEILNRLVDTGVVGLLSFVLMLVTIALAARAPIRARDSTWAAPALAVSSAAVAYLVLAFLFDVSSFPHTPYILMSLAGLLAVRAKQGDARVLRKRPAHARVNLAPPARRPEHPRPRRGPASADVPGHR